MPTVNISLGEYLFEFPTMQHWINKAQRIWKKHEVRADDTLCVDAVGRLVTKGAEFMRADREGTYPIKVYRMLSDESAAVAVSQEIVDRLNEQLTRFITGQCTCSSGGAPRETETEPGLQHYPGCPMINKIKLAQAQLPATHRAVPVELLERIITSLARNNACETAIYEPLHDILYKA